MKAQKRTVEINSKEELDGNQIPVAVTGICVPGPYNFQEENWKLEKLSERKLSGLSRRKKAKQAGI